MIAKCLATLLLLQVFLVQTSFCHRIPRKVRKTLPENTLSLESSPYPNELRRSRRCLGTALTLLWPQVVGPVDQGEIQEKNFDEVPKTALERRLDLIRKKAIQEEESRLMVRDYLKKLTEAQDEFYGYPPFRRFLDDFK